MKYRREKDSLGTVRVPAGALWGAQTQRAIDNFPVSGRRLGRPFIAALAHVKAACARANRELQPRRLPARLADAILGACREVASGLHDDQFPVDVFQTGSGTSSNMNANEVIANLANERLGGRRGRYRPVHPNDHVNMSQSSNDVIPTAAHVAALLSLRDDLYPALEALIASLRRKAREFDGVVKLGRTHLMDALPVRLGQVFGGYATQVRKGREGVEKASHGLHELALGGTAVGTGVNAPRDFGRRAAAFLRRSLGLPFREAPDHFEAQGARDDLVRLSGALRSLAASLVKIANDIRWMGSGPYGGLGELRLPPLQPGSSIMPGKVNPVLCEVILQVAAQVCGNDLAVALGGQGGVFELNTMMPVMIHNLLDSIAILSRAGRLFAEKCVDGLQADPARCTELLERNPIVATVLTPVLGYERTAQLVREALERNLSVKELVLQKGLLQRPEADRLFDFRRMTRPQ